MTKRNNWMYVGAVLAIALFTFGCGGDDNGLSASDMTQLDDATMATAAANAEIATLQAEIEASSDPDTSELDALIAELME